jgi:hypothetical protein
MSRYLLLLLLTISLSFKTFSQASNTARAFDEVIPALTAMETSQHNFGKFSPEVQGGQVIVTPDGIRSTSGSVFCVEELPNRVFVI